jgi:hypothetical protein
MLYFRLPKLEVGDVTSELMRIKGRKFPHRLGDRIRDFDCVRHFCRSPSLVNLTFGQTEFIRSLS